MDRQRFWRLIATHPAEEIVAAHQVLWDLMADSRTTPLWAAAYVFERVVADPASHGDRRAASG
ncbi:hypothetical protein [Streptomyces sp. NPDC046870]|uniref:hypothetical protein n=1 Tax=Streptomyces sp. NPDC046870 TaxID=3155135 RepID=UPI0034566F89